MTDLRVVTVRAEKSVSVAPAAPVSSFSPHSRLYGVGCIVSLLRSLPSVAEAGIIFHALVGTHSVAFARSGQD